MGKKKDIIKTDSTFFISCSHYKMGRRRKWISRSRFYSLSDYGTWDYSASHLGCLFQYLPKPKC